MYGMFHIMMCLFKCVGKFIAESGGPVILVESGVLASGSLNGFMKCSAFKRCKRIHSMLALACKVLRFKKFLKEYPKKDDVMNEMNEFDLQDKSK